jgi:hypothetical protein
MREFEWLLIDRGGVESGRLRPLPQQPEQAGRDHPPVRHRRRHTHPPIATGEPAPAPPLRKYSDVEVRIGGEEAQVLFAGLAPGFVGLIQINAVIPKIRAGRLTPVEGRDQREARPKGCCWRCDSTGRSNS